jgi:CheY-like chemotaxis protein
MKSVKILLVEDNDDDVVLVQDVFEQIPLGNELKTVSNGEAALALLRGRESGGVLPGLIILDINMPLMDGFEVLRELKGDRRLMKIPVVMLTGSNREEDRQRALELGASAFLTKPLDFEKLREAIVPLTLSWGISRKEDEPISA